MMEDLQNNTSISDNFLLHVDITTSDENVGLTASYPKVMHNLLLVKKVYGSELRKSVIVEKDAVIQISNVGDFILIAKTIDHLNEGFMLLYNEEADCDIDNFLANIGVLSITSLKQGYLNHVNLRKSGEFNGPKFHLAIPELVKQ